MLKNSVYYIIVVKYLPTSVHNHRQRTQCILTAESRHSKQHPIIHLNNPYRILTVMKQPFTDEAAAKLVDCAVALARTTATDDKEGFL